MFAAGSVSGAVISAVGSVPSSDTIITSDGAVQFQTRSQAITAADEILTLLDEFTEWREANQESLEIIDTGEVYQQIQQLAVLGAAALIKSSFALKQERSIILDRDRTIVDLEFELYGTIDDNVNLIINTNNLTGSEILELPVGKEILYYV